MDQTKPWYASKTIWTGAVVAAASLLGLLGYNFNATDQAGAVDDIVMIVTGIGGLATIVSRLFVKATVTTTKK